MLKDSKGKHILLKDSRKIRIHSNRVKARMLHMIANRDGLKDKECYRDSKESMNYLKIVGR